MERKTVLIPQEDIEEQLNICREIRERNAALPQPPLAFVDTYGCQQNEADSERLRGYLAEMGYGKGRNTPRFYAALFLLTANESIWRRAYNCFGRRGIEFQYFRYHGISIGDYALAMAARSIACGTDNFTLSDLEDREAVDDSTFRLVVSAVLIARYGMDVLKIGSESGAAYD